MNQKKSSLSELQLRVITGLLGATIMVSGMLYNDLSFGFLFLAITVLATQEFYKLLRLDGNQPLHWLGLMLSGLLFAGTYLVIHHQLEPKFLVLLFPLMALVFMVKLYRKDEKPFLHIAYTFLGLLYVAVPFSLLNLVAFSSGEFNNQLVSGCLFLLWASDSGAYFAGSKFGKNKLFERVSPKKSWEGFVGGMFLSLMVALILGQTFTSLPTWKWMFLSVIIVVCGTYGDLVESLFKRSISIKDSGSILPGHGGFLDRFDGLLLSSPFITTFVLLT